VGTDFIVPAADLPSVRRTANNTMEAIKIGDWVSSYSRGVWRVMRIIQDYRPPVDLPAPAQPLIGSARFLTASFKPRYGTEICAESFVKPLAADLKRDLDAFIATHPGALVAFEAQTPRLPDLVWNVRLGMPEGTPPLLSSRFFTALETGLTPTEVRAALHYETLHKYVDGLPATHTLQLVCANHEMRGRDFVFRTGRLIGA
jgi:hypothetical protein